MHSGRKPKGSRKPRISRSPMSTIENAPSMRRSAESTPPEPRGCASRCRMISLSTVVWKIEPFGLEFLAELGGVDEIAVVRDRDLAAACVHDERLRVFDRARSGRRISHVADGSGACDALKSFRRENLGHEAHALVDCERHPPNRWRKRCPRFPGRDAARRRGHSRRCSRRRDARKWRRRRIRGWVCLLAQWLYSLTRAGNCSFSRRFKA